MKNVPTFARLLTDTEPSPTNFLFCASFCNVMSGLRSRSTSFFSWSWACTQHKAAVKNIQIANDVRTLRGCGNECWFVKQNPISDWRPHVAGIERVFIVLAGTAADNGRMDEHVYKKIEIVGSSPNGMEEAVRNALSRASKTVRNMRWFEVTETRGYIDDGKIAHWQVTLKIGFTLEE